MKKERYERPIIQRQISGLMNKFGRRGIVQPMSAIDGVRVKRLVEDYGSPLFTFSEKTLRRKYKEAVRAFTTRYPKVQFAWSYKTNYLQSICSVFHQEGAWAEVVSEFEYEKAKSLKIPWANIIFNGPYKSYEALKKAALDGAMINIDNLDELYLLSELGQELKKVIDVGIRINLDTGIYPQWDRFGFNLENGQAYEAIKKIVYAQYLQLAGLHCHIGTFILSTDPYYQSAQKLIKLARSIKDEFNVLIKYLDLGGGFASRNRLHTQYLPAEQISPSFDQYAEVITSALLDGSFKPDELPVLILETGRALVNEAGFLISKVVATKRLPSGKRAIILDAGVNLLFTAWWYRHEIIPAQDFNEFMEDTIVYGPLCMQIDVIRESVMLPSLEKGDLVVIKPVGAYNVTQWMQFITYRPAVVLIGEDQQVDVIREREDLDYIIEKERIPQRLLKDKE